MVELQADTRHSKRRLHWHRPSLNEHAPVSSPADKKQFPPLGSGEGSDASSAIAESKRIALEEDRNRSDDKLTKAMRENMEDERRHQKNV